MINLDLIDRYFDNSLTPKEQFLFNELLENDEEFKNEFIFQKDLKKVVALSQREELKSTLQQFEKEVKPNSKWGMLPKKWLAAASISIVVTLGVWSLKSSYFPSNEAIYTEYFQPCRNTIQPIVRGESLNTIEYKAFAAYESRDYHKAINLFNSVNNHQEAYINYYKALSFLALDKAPEAIDLLLPIANSHNLKGKSENFNTKAEWYLALAYIKNEENKKAVTQLNLITEQPLKTFKKNEAQEILNYLN